MQAGLAFMQPQIIYDGKGVMHVALRDQEEVSVVSFPPVRPKKTPAVFCREVEDHSLHKVFSILLSHVLVPSALFVSETNICRMLATR